jgi:hypothetical protein
MAWGSEPFALRIGDRCGLQGLPVDGGDALVA